MKERFRIETVIENGQGHYKITDLKNGEVVHCDFSELNQILYELLEGKDEVWKSKEEEQIYLFEMWADGWNPGWNPADSRGQRKRAYQGYVLCSLSRDYKVFGGTIL